MKRKYLKRIFLSILILCVLFFITPAILILADGFSDEISQADVGIVLGNTVQPDGRPSPRLQARLDKAVELFQKGYFPNIIVSGGVGIEGFNEAVVMRQYLLSRDIPAERIILDSEGLTTELTAKNSALIMNRNNWKSALVVSQYFHISRTKLAFANYGVTPVYSAHANYFELRDLYSIIREIFGYYSYLLRGAEK